jgi:hypothetical protein
MTAAGRVWVREKLSSASLAERRILLIHREGGIMSERNLVRQKAENFFDELWDIAIPEKLQTPTSNARSMNGIAVL